MKRYEAFELFKIPTTPGNPSTDNLKMYFKSDGFLYKLDEFGVETLVNKDAPGIYGFKTFTGTMNGTTEIINDVDILVNSPNNVYFGATPVGNITSVATAGTITLTSTGTEVGLPYTVVIFASQTQNFSNPTGSMSYDTRAAKTDSTTYQAGIKGGLLVVTGLVPAGSGNNTETRIVSDSAVTPTTVVATARCNGGVAGNNVHLAVPILPNDYYFWTTVNSNMVAYFYENL